MKVNGFLHLRSFDEARTRIDTEPEGVNDEDWKVADRQIRSDRRKLIDVTETTNPCTDTHTNRRRYKLSETKRIIPTNWRQRTRNFLCFFGVFVLLLPLTPTQTQSKAINEIKNFGRSNKLKKANAPKRTRRVRVYAIPSLHKQQHSIRFGVFCVLVPEIFLFIFSLIVRRRRQNDELCRQKVKLTLPCTDFAEAEERNERN